MDAKQKNEIYKACQYAAGTVGLHGACNNAAQYTEIKYFDQAAGILEDAITKMVAMAIINVAELKENKE